ncbi:hypothetical protein STCU_09977 [Strigomonas culicis]|uniref:Uncharacterized protein n=1 Tax=Strigomonas culicis TaxID=28005 RepID=S9TPM5_9TRYP|nr:hypothetical protein STCU_09977 [Strigomonas culicis]|eukprot:EPY18413.1 hypothetical protein STCU_09977 [Strigomonas culicis]
MCAQYGSFFFRSFFFFVSANVSTLNIYSLFVFFVFIYIYKLICVCVCVRLLLPPPSLMYDVSIALSHFFFFCLYS